MKPSMARDILEALRCFLRVAPQAFVVCEALNGWWWWRRRRRRRRRSLIIKDVELGKKSL